MIKRYKLLKQTAFFFFVSYISIFIFSFTIYYNNVYSIFSFEIILKSILTSMILWYLLYFSSFHKYFYYFIIILLTLLLTIKIYYHFILGVHIEPSVFEGIFDTNLDEAKRLGSNKPLFIFLAILSFIAIILEFNWFKSFPLKKRVLIHFIKLSIALILLVSYGLHKNNLTIKETAVLLKQTFPLSFIYNLYQATDARYRLYKMNNSKIDIAKKYNFHIENDENLTVVFIRAESLRSRSFPISDINVPLSRRIDDINNTVFYNNVFSYANYTQAAVPWMLTRSIDDKLQNEKSLISVIKHMGFDTTWVGCDHSNIASFATPIVNFSLEANRSLFLGKLNKFIISNTHSHTINDIIGSKENSYDGKQFAYAITQIQNSKIGKKFLWIELNGSHVPWWPMIPKSFDLYKPSCHKVLDELNKCSQTEAKNTYKSTVIYTQYLLKKLILFLKNKNAIVFFASDHGESTGENGYYGHGFMLPENKRRIRDQINPAFMVWMSNTFKNNHYDKYTALKKNANKRMKHDIIFHSVLNGIGISGSIIDPNKSIFSNTFIGRDTPIDITFKKKNIIVDKFENNEIIFHMKESNPSPGYTSILNLNFKNNNSIDIFISDLYEKKEFSNRIKYFVYYKNKILYQGDIGDNKGTKDTSLKVRFDKTDKNILIKLVAQESIEPTWGWGTVAKIKIRLKEKR